ncbi:hypothetical protein [Neomesorhizobium albiziae]|uniref:hypothetical protein n=1 Tax=Neomesorhizobium albiziae TaxID=335020 RepID=UPI00313ED0CE
MYLEATKVHRRTIAAKGPVLQLTRPLDRSGGLSGFHVVTNLFGTKERVAVGLGTDVPGLSTLGTLLAWLRSPGATDPRRGPFGAACCPKRSFCAAKDCRIPAELDRNRCRPVAPPCSNLLAG